MGAALITAVIVLSAAVAFLWRRLRRLERRSATAPYIPSKPVSSTVETRLMALERAERMRAQRDTEGR